MDAHQQLTPLATSSLVTRSTDLSILLEAFVQASDEKHQTVEALCHHVLPQLASPSRLADMGCGNGAITCGLAPYFEQVIAVDHNRENLATLERQFSGKHLKLHLADINQYRLESKVDLALFSYSIGYLGNRYPHARGRNEHRAQVLQQYYKQLAAGGSLVLVGAPAQGAYQELFTRMQIPLHEELSQLNEYLRANYPTQTYSFPVTIRTSTLEQMMLALRLMVYDEGTTYAERLEELTVYARSCQQPDGCFRLSYQAELVVIRQLRLT